MSFLTLDEYLVGARRIMVAQKCGFLINDEDAVADVAHRMMLADQTWNGESSRDTWRYTQAKYALMRILTKRKKKHPVLSLDNGWWNQTAREGGGPRTLAEKVPSKDHAEIYDTFMEVCERARGLLNEKQYECLIRHHRDHMTMEAIGQEMGISKQRVSQHIQKGTERLQQCLSKLDL